MTSEVRLIQRITEDERIELERQSCAVRAAWDDVDAMVERGELPGEVRPSAHAIAGVGALASAIEVVGGTAYARYKQDKALGGRSVREIYDDCRAQLGGSASAEQVSTCVSQVVAPTTQAKVETVSTSAQIGIGIVMAAFAAAVVQAVRSGRRAKVRADVVRERTEYHLENPGL